MAARLQVLALLAAAGIVANGSTATRAGDPAHAPVEAPRPAAAAVNPDEIGRWTTALASDNYAERKAATHKLIEAGPAAIAPVAKAADSDDLELPGRCIGILKRLSESDDAATKRAAAAALRELSRSSREFLARKADEALREPAVTGPRAGFGGGAFVPLGQPQQQQALIRELTVDDNGRKVYVRYQSGNIREYLVRITETIDGREKTTEFKASSTGELRQKSEDAYALYTKHLRDLLRQPVQMLVNNRAVPVPAGIPLGGARMQVTVNNATGQREIRVDENARQVHITDNSGRDIVVRVTETVQGQPQTAEYKARDLDELKKLHPAEAAKLYETYASGQNGIRVFGGRGQIQIQAVPLQPGAPRAGGAEPDAERFRRAWEDRIKERETLARAEQFRREAEAARLAQRRFEESQRNSEQQTRDAAELRKKLADFAARMKTLAGQPTVEPDELRRLADELDRLSSPEKPDQPANPAQP